MEIKKWPDQTQEEYVSLTPEEVMWMQQMQYESDIFDKNEEIPF